MLPFTWALGLPDAFARRIARNIQIILQEESALGAVLDPAGGKIYVSNVVTPNEGYWVDDNNGFLSLLTAEAKIEKLRWLEGSAGMPIHAPKGMCILDGKLYFNDNTQLKRCSLDAPGKVEVIPLPGAKKLNDLATDGKSIWATDTETGKVLGLS